jgi:hypothetical protein
MDKFRIKTYSKSELATLYFPECSSQHAAVNRLTRWINQCTPLLERLERRGYKKTSKWYSAREVRLIVKYLGEP